MFDMSSVKVGDSLVLNNGDIIIVRDCFNHTWTCVDSLHNFSFYNKFGFRYNVSRFEEAKPFLVSSKVATTSKPKSQFFGKKYLLTKQEFDLLCEQTGINHPLCVEMYQAVWVDNIIPFSISASGTTRHYLSKACWDDIRLPHAKVSIKSELVFDGIVDDKKEERESLHKAIDECEATLVELRKKVNNLQ
jgi:hypothetical protein